MSSAVKVLKMKSPLKLENVLNLFIRFYQCFGLIPIKISNTNERSKMATVIVVLFLIIYWSGLIFSMAIKQTRTDRISVISNWIQLLINGVTLTVTQINPIIKIDLLKRILNSVKKFDLDIMELGIHINYYHNYLCLACIVTSIGLYTLYLNCYDFYVTMIRSSYNTIDYWTITIIPLIVYSFGLSMAFVSLLYIRQRFQALNVLLKREEKNNTDVDLTLNNNSTIILLSNDKIIKQERGNALSKILLRLSDLFDITDYISHLYGPLFLTTFTTIFVVTAVQLYYCYVVALIMDENRGYSLWTVFLSFNIVLLNVILVISITSVCQSITNQSKLTNCIASKLKIYGSRSHTSEV